ncbi:MAG: InlB B-repeat-containing protein, partial [Bacteroidota bacterium]
TTVTLTPVFATGYGLHHWGGPDGDEVTPEYTIVMDSHKNIAAIFAKLQYDLNAVSADEAAGSVIVCLVPTDRASYSIEHGQVVELIARPNPGYLFDGWDGGLTSEANPLTLTMTGPLAVTAHFTPGIQGRVFWQNSLAGVAGITVNAGGLSATTDAEGRWRIEGVSLPVTVTAAAPAASGYLGAAFSPAVTVYPVSAGEIQIAMISAYRLEGTWGGYGSGDGQFDQPRGVAVDAGGNVYVADYCNCRVQQFMADGTYITQWGESGYGNGQFRFPQGIAVSAGGYVYVADNNGVHRFTASGGYDSQLAVAYVGGVATDAADNIYVTEMYDTDHSIHKFAPDWTSLAQWGGRGADPGQCYVPAGVAVDAAGNVYVVDSFNHRVQKFTSGGIYLTQWGGSGSGNGQFLFPHGIAVDAAGYVYVTDRDNRRVQKFTADGAYITQWGDGLFTIPEAIAVSADGRVYVADAGDLIWVFRLLDGEDAD